MKFLKTLNEIFNTKNYTWEKYSIGRKATFTINEDIYYVCFDLIGPNAYNHYFYLEKDNIKYFDIINNEDKRSFKVFSNIKHILLEFLELEPYVEFVGFSALEKERTQLYTLYAQFIHGKNDLNKFIIKETNRNYYIIYNEKIGNLILNHIIDKFIIDDSKKK